jgi:hypothetical protein
MLAKISSPLLSALLYLWLMRSFTAVKSYWWTSLWAGFFIGVLTIGVTCIVKPRLLKIIYLLLAAIPVIALFGFILLQVI